MTAWPITRDLVETTPVPPSDLREVFPHVRVSIAERLVEFDAQVPINAHADDGSVVFLEVIACRRDTKEHEALAMTDALPSHVHAALLLLDLQPGSPGGWEWQGQTLTPIAPQGPGLEVLLAWQDASGTWIEHPALDLVTSRADARTFSQYLQGDTPDPDAPREQGRFAFAGSRFVQHHGREFYDADGAGVIVGLHTFGSEVVALRRVMSPEASVLEPEWIARADLLPERGTPLVVRIRAIQAPAP